MSISLVARAQNERARVLQSPFDVRNRDVHRHLQLWAGRRLMSIEESYRGPRRGGGFFLKLPASMAFRVERALRLDGREGDFRVLPLSRISRCMRRSRLRYRLSPLVASTIIEPLISRSKGPSGRAAFKFDVPSTV